MPTPNDILTGLKAITNDWVWLAMFWHAYFFIIILALIFGARPPKRVVGLLLALPLLSVSVLAWGQANPFNGTVFGIVAITLGVIALKMPADPVRIARPWLTVTGALMMVFGWVYPHFLVDAGPTQYLYAAPTGLIPCPTTSIVIGLSLLLGGFGSRAWCLVLAATGLFYGAFGALVLGVTIDWTLFAGALTMAWTGLYAVSRNNYKCRVHTE
jgi:hypothetical protein